MQVNTLSNRQEIHLKHNTTEGFFNRSILLLLLTNKESAYKIINKKKFRNEEREFGSGLYFVENLQESETFDIKDRAVVQCQVEVGVSLILTKPDKNINEKYLKGKNCDSVKGYLNMNQKYYIVYNYKKIQKIFALRAETSIVMKNEVSVKCINHLCKSHGKNHKDECKLYCKQKTCKFLNSYHKPPCELKCDKENCELFETFHESDCKIRCTWEQCLMYGSYHKQKCIHHTVYIESKDEGVEYKKIKLKKNLNVNPRTIKRSKLNNKILNNNKLGSKNENIQEVEQNFSGRNKFSNHFDQFLNDGKSRKKNLKGYYKLHGKNNLKKVKDEIYDSVSLDSTQIDLTYNPQPTFANSRNPQNNLSIELKDQQVAHSRYPRTNNTYNPPSCKLESNSASQSSYDKYKSPECNGSKQVFETYNNKTYISKDTQAPQPAEIQNIPQAVEVIEISQPQIDQNINQNKNPNKYIYSSLFAAVIGASLFGIYKIVSKRK